MPQEQKRRGPLYWFVYNTLAGLRTLLCRHPVAALLGALVLLSLLFLFRPLAQPVVISLRRYAAPLALLLLLALLFKRSWRRATRGGRVALGLFSCGLVCAIYAWGLPAYDYLSLYARYRSLSLIELDELPLTDHERIHPRNSIYSLAHEVMSASEAPGLPEFVRVGEDYRWTAGIEPTYLFSRLMGEVKEVLSVPATTASPAFSKENRIPVSFTVGEKLLFSHKTRYAVIRAFGLRRFINYEPGSVMYFTDDEGRWVQAVSLIRWSGWLFPRPEFGGVQLIEQEEPSWRGSLTRLLFGRGRWIKPGEIQQHAFLRGQNILEPRVARYIANSFRFAAGFLAPLPGYHQGDVRIPDMAADVNRQPFSAYFAGKQLPGKLYDYFALEPSDPRKQGLNTSLFVPADGEPIVYAYKHHDRGESIIGVSAVTAKVMESRKMYDWTHHRPVEHRPFIRSVGGKNRFFWLTTVVTFKDASGNRRFIAGSIPDLILTDAAYNASVWVSAMNPGGWLAAVQKELLPVWSAQEQRLGAAAAAPAAPAAPGE